MSGSESTTKKPSELLAEVVLKELVKKKLILSDDVPNSVANLMEGKLKAEDWRLLVEKAMDKDSPDE